MSRLTDHTQAVLDAMHSIKTVDELAAESGLKPHDYDTALPQGWVDIIYEKTGEWAAHMNIVWDYRGNSWGRPLGLDPEAKAFLEECGEA